VSVGRRRCHLSRVLHDPWGTPRASVRGRDRSAEVRTGGTSAGTSLIEVLISLSILAIGIFAVLALLVAARRDAEAAADRAALALAARQVLETHLVGGDSGLPFERVVPIGVHRIRVRLEAETASSGLLRLRSRARDTTGGRSWIVETLAAVP